MKNLYLKIIETIENWREEFTARGLLPVETIDLYDGQPEDPEKFEFTAPALFVDYAIEWERGGSAQKRGIITLEIHVLTQPEGNSENFSSNLPEALKKIEFYNAVSDLLETVYTDNISRLALIEEKPVQTEYYCYHLLKFNAAIVRNSPAGHIIKSPNVKFQYLPA